MKSKIKISELKVEAVVPNLDLFTKDKEKQKQISTLLPELVQENISFVLDNTNTATANAIRRGVLSEISWKVMCVDPTSVVTNEPFLKVHEFCKRLAFIPIMQDIPTGTTFSISVRNTNMTENRMIVHSDAIKVDNSSGSANSKTAKALFDSTYRIAELHPGNYLKVDGITIREGYSFMIDEPDGANAKFCPVANVQYAVLDYTPVYVLNNKQQFTSTYMRTSDLIKLDSGLKTLWSKSRIDFHNSKIAIMEDGSYAKGLEGLDLQKYNHVEYKIVVPKLPEHTNRTSTTYRCVSCSHCGR
jgi:hypothetical protein